MKKVIFTILILASVTTVWAQGPFNDVPTDHWAYEAINKLQQDGVLIGYPDGTFSGKRAVTRYEFATALARVLGTIPSPGGVFNNSGPLQLRNRRTDFRRPRRTCEATDIPDVSKFATKADLDRDFQARQ